MFRKLLAVLGVLILSLGTLVMPVSAQDAIPSDSEDSCVNAGGDFFSIGPALVPEIAGSTRTWETTNTCVVTTYHVDRENTAHKNFAVDFNIKTVTTYKTTITEIERWVVVGTEPGTTTSAWQCLNPQRKSVGDPWGDGVTHPSVGAPNNPNCAGAARTWPAPYNNSLNQTFVVEAISVTEPAVDIYGWVLDESATTYERSSNAVSSVDSVLGCWNFMANGKAGGYLDDINSHCQAVIDSYEP